METTVDNPVLRFPAAEPADAAIFFAARMTFQTDVSDVHTALESGQPGFTLIDTRGSAAWEQGHLPGAIHLPTDDIVARAAPVLPRGGLLVTYCWGPGCNGATRAALLLSQLGYRVKEMLGGYEYWVREGFPVRASSGARQQSADPLTVAASAFHCEC